MSKKIKAKNKHLRQNIRGHTRRVCKERGLSRTELEPGVFRYREKSNFNKKAHKPNAYQARKKSYSSKSGKASSFFDSLFS